MKFIDETGTIWVMEPDRYGGVRIRVPECDDEFEFPEENGYWYPDEKTCLKDMKKCYGVMTPLTK